jgi:acetyltransferase-like isoleucine patch superfamily enzyme
LAIDESGSSQCQVINYRSGGHSFIPARFFRTWRDEEPDFGTFYIGRCSGFGIDSLVKYDTNNECLKVGRFVAGGLRMRFLLNGQHDSRTISTYMFSITGMNMRNRGLVPCGNSEIKNDVWLGDEMMMLGGGIIENGCIIGARALLKRNFRSEPYGIYGGTPARLIRFRFTERVREALLQLAWWEMPLSWIKENNDAFMVDLSVDEQKSLDLLARLQETKRAALKAHPEVPSESLLCPAQR